MAELIAPASSTPVHEPQPLVRNLLRWLYIGRLTIVTGIFAGAFLDWFGALPAASGLVVLAQDFIVVVPMFVLAVTATAASVWYTHWLGRQPGENFLYGQVVLDVLIVTAIVQVTGGLTGFSSLYILVISEGALLLPLPGGVLIGALVSIVYFAVLTWGRPEGASDPLTLGLNIGLFSLVAIITGLVGDRLRRAGQAVASQLRQLRLDTGDILANLSTGVLTLTGEGRLAYVNPAAETLLGARLQDRIGEPLLGELEEIAPGMGTILAGAIRDRIPVTRARARAASTRGLVQLGVSTAILERSEGEPPSVTALFQDITDLERLEELRLRAERLEAVAGLSASLAHEIKNPLASIRSSVEQLSQRRITDGDRAVLERLVLTESDRLSRLLSEFLDFSGLKMSAREEFDLYDVVRECLVVVKQHPDTEGVEIAGELDDGPLPMVGDADLIHRALFNLVLNGAQSAGAGGRVVVRLEDERDRAHPRGTDVKHPYRLTVSDSGAGVSPEVRTRIFDPFFTTKEDGSGLGLAVVHRAVEAHAGATFVEQGPDGGAQFVIFLPGEPAGAPVGAGEVSP